VLVFNPYYWADSDDSDDLGFGRLHFARFSPYRVVADVSEGILVAIVDYPGAGGQPHDVDGTLGRVCVPLIDPPQCGCRRRSSSLTLARSWPARLQLIYISRFPLRRSLLLVVKAYPADIACC
jgi:hypothetical protein